MFIIFGSKIMDEYLFDIVALIYFLGILVIAFASYNSTTVQLLNETYKHHKMAFNSHKKSLLGLFVLTELSLLCLII